MGICSRRRNEKVNKQNKKKQVGEWIEREADRQRNRRITLIRRLTREQNRNSKCSSAAKLFIGTVGRSFFEQWADSTCFSVVNLCYLTATIFLWQRNKMRDGQKVTKWWKRYCCISPGIHFCLPWRPCCKEGRGNNTRGRRGREAVEVVLRFSFCVNEGWCRRNKLVRIQTEKRSDR